MFEHYLSNKNERATVAPKSKFRELNKGQSKARQDLKLPTTSTTLLYVSTSPLE